MYVLNKRQAKSGPFRTPFLRRLSLLCLPLSMAKIKFLLWIISAIMRTMCLSGSSPSSLQVRPWSHGVSYEAVRSTKTAPFFFFVKNRSSISGFTNQGCEMVTRFLCCITVLSCSVYPVLIVLHNQCLITPCLVRGLQFSRNDADLQKEKKVKRCENILKYFRDADHSKGWEPLVYILHL